MTKPISLSVFFPVYNEEENLPVTVAETIRTLEESPFVDTFEIILVNDGSKDGSRVIAERLAQKDGRVRVVHHPHNMGYGQALVTGIQAARMDYVFFTDADLQFDIVEVNALLAHVDRYPVVIGYRSPRRDPFMRLANAWGWNLLNRILFGLHIRDIDCAFKIFKRELVQELPLESKGAMISAEILIRLTRAGVSVKELPVSHLPRKYGSATGAKLSVILRAFREMLRLYTGELGLASVHQEMLKFMAVGVVNTLIDVVLYFALTRFTFLFSVHLIAAKFFSFLGGTISSLYLNRSWTFGIKDDLTAAEVIRFYSMVSVSIFIDVYVMALFVKAGMYDLLALVLTTGFVFVTNFALSKLWVFKPKAATDGYPVRLIGLDSSVPDEQS
jgi:glycosyltransferase involved in cell wall biosynthesis